MTREVPPAADAADAYVTRASRWIEGTTRKLARQWLNPASDERDADGAVLSDYHRYEIARLLEVTHSSLLETVERAREAGC